LPPAARAQCGGADRLSCRGDASTLALRPLRDAFAGDHAEADKGVPHPLHLVEGKVQPGGDHPQIYIGERPAIFFVLAGRLK
jgi:hypothetical protein